MGEHRPHQALFRDRPRTAAAMGHGVAVLEVPHHDAAMHPATAVGHCGTFTGTAFAGFRPAFSDGLVKDINPRHFNRLAPAYGGVRRIRKVFLLFSARRFARRARRNAGP